MPHPTKQQQNGGKNLADKRNVWKEDFILVVITQHSRIYIKSLSTGREHSSL